MLQQSIIPTPIPALSGRSYKIYILRDPHTNSIRYVGQTVRGLKDRFLEHINNSKKHKENTYKAKWIKKLLRNNLYPKIELLKTYNTADECNKAEIYYIDLFKKMGCKLTNITLGGANGLNGFRGHVFTDEHRRNLSKALMGRKNPMYGKKQSAETIRKRMLKTITPERNKRIGDAHRGMKRTEQAKANMKKAQQNLPKEVLKRRIEKWRQSEKVKKRHIELKGKPIQQFLNPEIIIKRNENKKKPIIQMDLEGNYIIAWRSAKDAEIGGGFSRKKISCCCLGINNTHSNFKWQFAK